MSDSTDSKAAGTHPQLCTAAGIVIALWGAYTVVYTSPLDDGLGAILELIPGVLGIVILLAAGLRPQDLYLRVGPVSGRGLAVLAVVVLLLIPPLLSGQWVGFRLLPVLVYAPASGVAQELFFRAALLPALVKVLGRRPGLAITLHALLFAVWHVPLSLMTAPVAPVPATIAITLVTFLAGMGWGWQVHRDRTLIWALGQHIFFLMMMALFGL